MSNFSNKGKKKGIKKANLTLLKELNKEFSKMSLRCKFNFSYLDINQEKASSFHDFSKEQLEKILQKLQDFSKESIMHWKRNTTFVNYNTFPKPSNFVHPKFVPNEVEWGRFRLEGDFRLAGFTVPYSKTENDENLDINTFYVVFLDPEHNFYLSKKNK